MQGLPLLCYPRSVAKTQFEVSPRRVAEEVFDGLVGVNSGANFNVFPACNVCQRPGLLFCDATESEKN